MRKTGSLLFFMLFLFCRIFSQPAPVLAFDFNDHEIKENNRKINVKPVGVLLINDRFGNAQSAIYTLGIANSYLNFGSSLLLKSKRGTLSIWVNVQAGILSGKGYSGNPFLLIKNAPGEDFIIGFGVGYDVVVKRLSACRNTLLLLP